MKFFVYVDPHQPYGQPVYQIVKNRYCYLPDFDLKFPDNEQFYALSLLFAVNGPLVALIITEVCRGDRFHSASTYLSSRPQTDQRTVKHLSSKSKRRDVDTAGM